MDSADRSSHLTGRKKLSVVGGLVATVVALGVSGCGTVGHTGASRQNRGVVDESVAKSRAPAHYPGGSLICGHNALGVHWSSAGATQGVMGSDVYGLTITNVGKQECSVRGWPRVSISVHRSRLRPRVVYGAEGSDFGPIFARKIELPPDKSATANVERGDLEGGPKYCRSATWRISLPGLSNAEVSDRARKDLAPLVCTDDTTIVVTPFFRGNHPLTAQKSRGA